MQIRLFSPFCEPKVVDWFYQRIRGRKGEREDRENAQRYDPEYDRDRLPERPSPSIRTKSGDAISR